MTTSTTYPASLENLAAMTEQVVEAAKAVGFSDIDLARLELVAEEAFVNIVSYGFDDRTEDDPGQVTVTCSFPEDNCLKVVVKDNGMEFDPIANAEDVDAKAPLEDRSYGGYGVFFILKIMDTVTYERVDDHNVLTMIKFRET